MEVCQNPERYPWILKLGGGTKALGKVREVGDLKTDGGEDETHVFLTF